MTAHGEGNPVSSHATRPKLLRVLCAEDDEQVGSLVQFALEQAGHLVERAGDGQEALERITSDLEFFDVLVTDHQMPRLSGLGLVSKLRDTAFSGRIIVHSSRLTAAEAEAYRALAVDHFLSKPTELAELLITVQQVAENTP